MAAGLLVRELEQAHSEDAGQQVVAIIDTIIPGEAWAAKMAAAAVLKMEEEGGDYTRSTTRRTNKAWLDNNL